MVLTRYRRLRQISKEHHQAVLDITAPALLCWTGPSGSGLTRGKTLILESEHELTLVEDLATYLHRLGRSQPLDRYARAAQFTPRLRRGDRARGDGPCSFLPLACRAEARKPPA